MKAEVYKIEKEEKEKKEKKERQYTMVDLFTGIAGFSLALNQVCKTIAYSDINATSQTIIAKHIECGRLDNAHIFGDVKELNKNNKLQADIVTAGFPCQDISVSNLHGKGIMGERSVLVFEALRVAKLVHASIIILENSPNIVNKGIDILTDALHSQGYTHVYDFFSASQIGAPHLRKRFYLLAYKKGPKSRQILQKLSTDLNVDNKLMDKSNTAWNKGFKYDKVVARNPHSYSDIQKRTFLLGNSIVPQCAKYAIHFLSHHALRSYHSANIGRGYLNLSNYTLKNDTPFTMKVPNEKHIDNDEFRKGELLQKERLSTPLSQAFDHTCVGSSRASRILQNEIMYDVTTLSNKSDKNVDHWIINPKYIEWLMGYPANWTRIRMK